jgi:NAD(P)-dependent dehydrogenase (short-subunit alcohol dehydrogenase family)
VCIIDLFNNIRSHSKQAARRNRQPFETGSQEKQAGDPDMTVTLITGGNKGLGRETARRLIKEGHSVYIGARSAERGEAAAAELGARFVRLDVTDDASVASALQEIGEREGHLDVLVNNAGIALVALNGPEALQVFDTNAVGIIRVTEAALPLLRKSANPVVVNITSALGSFWAVTNPEHPASHVPAIVYGASKAAASMLTLQYARAVPEVKFNAVDPGPTDTDLTAGRGGRPVGRSAEVIVRLATIGADGPTGTFQVDAGEFHW